MDENSLKYDLGLATVIATSALSRETLAKGTLETPETHTETRLKHMLVRIRETLKRTVEVNQCCSVVAGSRQKYIYIRGDMTLHP
jgi:hypothetical protein